MCIALVRVSIAVMKHHNQKESWGGKCLSVLYFHTLVPSLKEARTRNSNRTGTWRQELMQKPWKGAAYWLVHHGLLSLLCYRTQDHQPRDGTTHRELGPHYQLLRKKMPYRLMDNLMLCRHFHN